MWQDADTGVAQSLGADVCVIGAGPAGLTVASRIADSGGRVVVVEAGRSAYDRHELRNMPKAFLDHLHGAQSLTRGRTKGEPYYPLRMSRARGLGGSANALLSHGLRARPLDPIDFASRFESEWPIQYDDMAAFLPDAEALCGITTGDGEPVDWDPRASGLPFGELTRMVAAPFRHGARSHFPDLAHRVAQHENAEVLTSAVVREFSMRSGAVSAVAGLSLSGRQFRVSADKFVIAAGGIDNARLIMASRSLLFAMGAAADHVGRSFMEHLHYVAGYLVPTSTEAAGEVSKLFGDPEHPAHWLTPADNIVIAEDLLRVSLAALPVHADSLHPAVPAAGELARILPFGPFGGRQRLSQLKTALGGLPQIAAAATARLRGEARDVFALGVMSEQSPDSASRITFGPQSDRFGLPLPELHWVVGDRDFDSAARTVELLAADMAAAGVGDVVSLWDEGESRPPVVTGGWHHMGTTRMSDRPETGVVDRDCRIYGVDNLFAAGSSVFATSGYANPTLALVALAVRLADRLGR